eukprot:Anaeramoba_ignava/a479007_25.p1 GENE.a479007_25~~a479007_25.p1  ORF type:complete len:664 (+),score=196.47 a479007_25:9-2000(+)
MLTDKEIENGWIKIIKNNPPISRYGQCSGCYMNQHFSFGGDGISGYLSDLICFDFITHEWKEIELTGDIPEKRTGHSGVIDHQNGIFYIFGGIKDGGVFLNDLTAIDLNNFSCKLLKHSSTACEPRSRTTPVLYNNKIYLFGGFSSNYGDYNDICCFDLERSKWSKIPTKGNPPLSRGGHVTLLQDDTMYIFGGCGGRNPHHYNDLHTYNISKNEWKNIKTKGKKPFPRRNHSAAILNNKIYIYGGKPGDGTKFLSDQKHIFQDFWVYDIKKNKWEEILPQSGISNVPTKETFKGLQSNLGGYIPIMHAENWPSGRVGHSFATLNNSIILFGGIFDLQGDFPLNDLFVYNVSGFPEQNQFKEIMQSEKLCDKQLNLFGYSLLCNSNLLQLRLNQFVLHDPRNDSRILELNVLENYLLHSLGKEEVVKALIMFLYCGIFDNSSIKTQKSLLELYQLAKNLDFKELILLCEGRFVINEENSHLWSISQLYNQENTKNFTLTVGNETVIVHKFVLALRSKLYFDMFRSVDDSSNVAPDLSGLSVNAVKELIKFFYFGKIDENFDLKICLELSGFSDYYQLYIPLETFITQRINTYLASKKTRSWSVDDVCLWLTVIGFGDLIPIFLDLNINGSKLMKIKFNELKTKFDMNIVGPRLLLNSKIRALK